MKKKHYVMDEKKRLLVITVLLSILIVAVPVNAYSYEIAPGGITESGHDGLGTPNITMLDCITSITMDMPEAWGMGGATQSFPARLNDAGAFIADASFSMVSDDYSNPIGHVTSHMDFTNWQTANMTSGIARNLQLEPLGAGNTTYSWISDNGSVYDPANVVPPYSTSIPFLAWGAIPVTIPYKTLTIETSGACGGIYFEPDCSFTAVPTSGAPPLLVTFTDTSSGTPTSWEWNILENGTAYPIYTNAQNWQTYLYGANKYFDVKFNATNAYGTCSLSYPNYLSTTGDTTPVSIVVNNKDITTGYAISNSNAGIYNGTDNSWYNKTATTGQYAFNGTGTYGQYPLTIGQNVLVAGWANGYKAADPLSDDNPVGYYNVNPISANYQVITINLIPVTLVPAAGTGNLIVTVKKDKTGAAFDGATVAAGTSTKLTNSAGIAMFYNITPATISVTASDVWYQSQTQSITIVSGATANASFSLVMLGETPVTTTVVPTQVVTTGTPIPTYTDATGEPISAPEGQALDVFTKIAAALGTWVNVVVSIITIWLLWILVYEITGGKVISKIMKRGRR